MPSACFKAQRSRVNEPTIVDDLVAGKECQQVIVTLEPINDLGKGVTKFFCPFRFGLEKCGG